MQRRTSRYPTRSTVNKAPNYTGEVGSSNSSPSSSSSSSTSSCSSSSSHTSRSERRSVRSSTRSQASTKTSQTSSHKSSSTRYAQSQPPSSMHQQQHHPASQQAVQNTIAAYHGSHQTMNHQSHVPSYHHQRTIQPPLNLPNSHQSNHLGGHHYQQQQQQRQQQLTYAHNATSYHREQQHNQQVLTASTHQQAAPIMYSGNTHYGQNRVQPPLNSHTSSVMAHHSNSMLSHVVSPNITVPTAQILPNLSNQNGTVPMYHPPQPTAHIQNNYNNYSMPRLNNEIVSRNTVQFLKLNSYDDVRVLIKPRTICTSNQSNTPGNGFRINEVSPFLYNTHPNDEFKVFLRFCKPSSSRTHQLDCLPKSFNLMINQAAFQVKNKYTFAPYDITSRIVCERGSDMVHLRISIDLNANESNDEFYYGLFLVKKIDHKKLFENFRNKFKIPTDRQLSIDLVKKKLNSGDNEDEIAIVENENLIKVSLLCPLTSTRIKLPARSIACDHVHCFEAKTFIEMNEITPRWKCPHCKIFIKIDDLIVDGFFMEILNSSPPNCDEAEIYPDGTFKYIRDNTSVPGISVSLADLNPSSSTPTKRKFEEDIKDNVQAVSASPGPKAPKIAKEIECITIDDSDGDDGSSTSSSTIDSDLNQDSDGELEIVFERIVSPPVRTATSTTTTTNGISNNNITSNSNNANYNNFNHNHNTYSNNHAVPSSSRHQQQPQSQSPLDALDNIWAKNE